VSEYLSEEEQVEALKRWWRENGRSVIAGIVIGLAVVFGWQSWVQYRHSQMEGAAARFDQLHQAAQIGEAESAQKQGELLRQEHGRTIYAAFAALDLARLLVEQGDAEGAKGQLQWVLEQAREPAIQEVARIRLARLQLGLGDTAAAEKSLAAVTGSAFAGEVAELRGDLARARNDLEAARTAYQDALVKGTGNSMLLRMKLQDIGGDPDLAAGASS
jgi:predicted negative regulator of RcsB-dependent stress response